MERNEKRMEGGRQREVEEVVRGWDMEGKMERRNGIKGKRRM